MRFEYRLHANARERLVRTVFGNFKILHSSAWIDDKAKAQRPDIN